MRQEKVGSTMTAPTKSSPLPWTADLDSDHGDYAIWSAADKSAFVANIDVDERKGLIAFDVAEEDAALIVKAVNSHAALVEALEAAKDRMIQEGCDCGVDEPETCALCVVTAALSLAKDSK
jgi:hypothetical protein